MADTEEKTELGETRKYAAVLLVAVTIFLIIAAFYSPLTALLALIVIILAPFALYYLAANIGAYFFILEEGFAIVIEYNGEYYKTLFRYSGRVMDPDGTIRYKKDGEKEEEHPFGGFVWTGFWPFFQVKGYTLRWKSLRPNGNIIYREEKLKKVLLKDDVYVIELVKKKVIVDGIETEVDERPETIEMIPVDEIFLLTGRITTPQKALYGIQDWFEAATNRIKQLMKEYTGGKTLSELYSDKQESREILYQRISKELFHKMQSTPEEVEPGTRGETREEKEKKMTILEAFEQKYGFLVSAIEPYSIAPPPEVVTTSIAKWTGAREAEKTVEIAKGNAQAKLIDALAETTRIKQIFSIILKTGTPGLFIRSLEAQEQVAKSGKSTHYLAPTGSVDGISKMMVGAGITADAIKAALKELSAMEANPEEIKKALDIMKEMERNPEMKKAFEAIKPVEAKIAKPKGGRKNVKPKS
jgi:regulator of protease activity HflC (stomatin/prohibitin superfamily)